MPGDPSGGGAPQGADPHLPHTGPQIPETIVGAIESWALHYAYMFDIWRRRFRKNRAALEEALRNTGFADGYDYPPSVAGWVIGQRGNFLAPFPRAFVKDLPTWSGLNHPYSLIVSPDCWQIRDEDGELLETIDTYARMVDIVWRRISAAGVS